MKCADDEVSKRQKKYKGSTRCIVILFKYGSALFECKVVSGGGHEQWNIPPHVAGHWALRRSRPALKLNNSKSLHYANRPGSRWQGWAKCVMLVLRPTLHPGQPFVCPINVSAARKGSEGGLFNIKSIEPFSDFLSRGTSWCFFLGDSTHSPLHVKNLAASFTKNALRSIKKRKH